MRPLQREGGLARQPAGRGAPGAAQAGKGFGAPAAPQRKGAKAKEGAQGGPDAAVQEAIRDVKGRRARPVDAREAAKGRLDFAQVKSWGSGRQEDLGQLQVAKYVTSGAGAGAPLYEQLGHHLQELQATGGLEVAASPGAPTPRFERWTFRPRRYIAWLKDQYCLHSRLEAALAAALEAQPSPGASKGAFAALCCLGPGAGLGRAAELAKDLAALQQAFPEEFREAEETPNGSAYGLYVQDMGASCVGHEAERERERAALRLFANAYAVYVTHLTSGMRVGAAAGERLNLFAKGATHFYQAWHTAPGKDPLEHLKERVNSAGGALNGAEELKVKVELGRAVPKIGTLLSTVADDA